MKPRNWLKKGLSGLLTASLVATMSVAPAFADVPVGSDTSWTVPSGPKTNVVTVGGKDYKVITTQTAANWVTAGPDYLGISNSANLVGDNAKTLEAAQSSSMMGIWTTANEVPNAYNWNFFWDLYAAANSKSESGMAIVNDGTSFDSASGTAAGLKYRPEIMWSDALATTSSASLGTMAGYIRDGKYYDSAVDKAKEKYTYTYTKSKKAFTGEAVKTEEKGQRGSTTYYWDEEGWTTAKEGYADHQLTQETVYEFSGEASKYAAPHDSDYNPIEAAINVSGAKTGDSKAVMSNTYNNPLLVSQVLYSAATGVEQVKAATANYDGKDLAGKAVNASNATWLTMNALPRTTRYEASTEDVKTAREAALAYEQLEKGSVYYVLSQVAAGNVKMKKVAFVYEDPDLSGNTAAVTAMNGADGFNPGGNASNSGFAGVAPFAVDQFVPASYTVGKSDMGGDDACGGFVTGTATCDELASCDVIFLTGVNGTNGQSAYTQEQVKNWMIEKCTTAENKAKAATIQYATVAPTQSNAKNFSVDKSIYGLHTLDFAYPELFPNMELETFWYDNIYHVAKAYVKQAMQWCMANTSLPDGVELAKLYDSYSYEDMQNKFAIGYKYYTASQSSDARLARVASNKGLITDDAVNFAAFAPSADYATWADSYSLKQVISVPQTKYSKKVTDKAFSLGATLSTGGTPTYTVSSGTGVVTVSKTGEVTIKKSGTAKINITAPAANGYDAADTVTVTVSVAKATQKLSAKKSSYTVKAGTAYKNKKTTAVLKGPKLSFKTSGNGKVTYAAAKSGKVSVAKNGKISVAKGATKKTYTLKVPVTAAATAKYAKATKTIAVKVVVK